MKYLLPIFILNFLISSCQVKEELTLEAHKDELVAWGILSPNRPIKVYLSHSFSPLTNEPTDISISGALVILLENNIPVDTLGEGDIGEYNSVDFIPTAGSVYAIQVVVQGYPTLLTHPDTLPSQPLLKALEVTESGQSLDVSLIVDTLLQLSMVGGKAYNTEFDFAGNWFTKGPDACQNLPKLEVFSYKLADYSCSAAFNSTALVGRSVPQDVKNSGLHVSFCFFSNTSLERLERMALYHELSSDVEGTSVFFEPIHVPIEAATGGFGHLFCFTTIDSLIQF